MQEIEKNEGSVTAYLPTNRIEKVFAKYDYGDDNMVLFGVQRISFNRPKYNPNDLAFPVGFSIDNFNPYSKKSNSESKYTPISYVSKNREKK